MIPWDVQRHRDQYARREIRDPHWAERPTFIRDDGIIVLTGAPLYRCVCGKQHLTWTGPWTSTRPRSCPCGEPFPPDLCGQWR